jgi:hypothetical protein
MPGKGLYKSTHVVPVYELGQTVDVNFHISPDKIRPTVVQAVRAVCARTLSAGGGGSVSHLMDITMEGCLSKHRP